MSDDALVRSLQAHYGTAARRAAAGRGRGRRRQRTHGSRRWRMFAGDGSVLRSGG